MKKLKANRREALAGIATLTGLAASKSWAQENDADPETFTAAFDIDEIKQRNDETDGPWLQFFDNNTMFSGHYAIPAGGEDRQQPHRFDELYYVLSGSAKLIAGEDTFDAKAGGIFFVKAQIPHRFVEVEEDLEVLVFFSRADPKG